MLGEGFIILVVGMGITFTFLLLLWLLIRLIGLLDRRTVPAAARVECQGQVTAQASPPAGPDDGRAVAAALAVALALEGRGASAALEPAAAAPPTSGWRLSGRRGLMAGPERVAAVRAARGPDSGSRP